MTSQRVGVCRVVCLFELSMKYLCVLALLMGPSLGHFLQTPPIAHPYIIGGKEVIVPGTYPFTCALENVPLIGQPSFNCGCVLIDEQTLITAAHCLSTNVDRYRFLVGAHDRMSRVDGEPTFVYASEIILHPDWDNNPSEAFPNDVAVIRLNDTVPDSVYIQPIPLPESDRNPDDWLEQECHIVGWGRVTGGGDLPNILRWADIPVIAQQECINRWIPYPVNEGHVCVFDAEAEATGSCNGDSGGPLVCRDTADDDWELVGLTSWGLSGCGTNYPSVYTRVSYFADWIQNPDPEQ